MRLAAVLAALALAAALPEGASDRVVLDSFERIEGWRALPSEGVRMELSGDRVDGREALRLDFDFQGRAGWAAARKAFPRRLPENWAFEVRIRGEAPIETLEFKLIDPSGENVWWSVRRGFEFPREWTTLTIPKRRVAFAWGPVRAGGVRELGSIEITVTAEAGGRGSVWIDQLSLRTLPSSEAPLPPPSAWRSDPAGGEEQQLVLPLGAPREIGGLALDWDASDFARSYAVEASADGRSWSPLRRISQARGGPFFVPLPDAQAAFVRLRMTQSSRGHGYVLRRVEIEPPGFAETPTKFLESVARRSPRGRWPRSLIGEQLYWAVVGVDGGREKALLSEDGALETAYGGFTLEPFLRAGGSLAGWADAQISHALAEGDLPISTVTRRHSNGLSLEVTAFGDGPPEASTIRARYRLRNGGPGKARATLYLTLRPVQVNPPWQFLNVPGGFAPIRRVSWDGRQVIVDGGRRIVPLTAPSAFRAVEFGGGDVVAWLADGLALPESSAASDPDGYASGVLTWEVELAPRASRDVVIAVPMGGAADPRPARSSSSRPSPAAGGRGGRSRPDPASDFAARLDAAARLWREKLGRVVFRLPPRLDSLARTVRSSLGWILVDRDGPAIQPGTRAYARSWVRDGALVSAALLRLGQAEEVRDFLRWFAPHEFESGAVPCCVDRRGADPVPENDSHGELLYLAGEYFRFTGDRETVEAVWPHLEKAAAYIDALRQKRRTAEYRMGDRRLFFGLLPESISHEGYSDKPAHSYWDDFWALRGLADAAELARALGRSEEARRFAAWRDEMRADVEASIRSVISARGLDYVPGSADLGDFDATSTAIALSPASEGAHLPREELERTFERYWDEFVARRQKGPAGKEYTPYEWRIAGAFLRLDCPERAEALSDFFMADRRPAEWNQWAEVVWRDPREPKFIGDMPHGWVAAEFLRAFLDRFVYEREEDDALVLAAGIPAAWIRAGEGVSVEGLRTRYGRLDLALRAQGPTVRVRISGDTRVPPGGFALRSPWGRRFASASIDGTPVPVSGAGEVLIRSVPVEVVLR